MTTAFCLFLPLIRFPFQKLGGSIGEKFTSVESFSLLHSGCYGNLSLTVSVFLCLYLLSGLNKLPWSLGKQNYSCSLPRAGSEPTAYRALPALYPCVSFPCWGWVPSSWGSCWAFHSPLRGMDKWQMHLISRHVLNAGEGALTRVLKSGQKDTAVMSQLDFHRNWNICAYQLKKRT